MRMAKLNKIIVSNKELQVLNEQSDYLQNVSKSGILLIVKDLKDKRKVPSCFSAAGVNKALYTTNSKLNIISIRQQRPQVLSYYVSQRIVLFHFQNAFPQFTLDTTSTSAIRDNVEDIFPRAVRLFMINYYYKPEYKHLSKEELLLIASTIQINLTADDTRFIEEITQDEKKSWYWQKLVAGRVTASRFKSVCTTSLSHPDESLLKEICYPETCIFSSDAMTYKNQTKDIALSSFSSQMEKVHKNFKCEKVGLIVDRNCAYFAASPDGLCSCTCCGEYCVEIKRPLVLSQKNAYIESLLKLDNAFLEVINGNCCLKRGHDYYYELQMQMALCRHKFCYFYVWSPRIRITNKVYFNSVFYTDNSARALMYAKEVLTIELMNSHFTNTY